MNQERLHKQLTQSARTIQEMVTFCSPALEQAARLMVAALKGGHKILWCGNGGSAAQAQHFSTELVGGLRFHDRPGLASLALSTDTSLLTAWTNDVDFETVFARQVETLGAAGDVLVLLSTSGNSPNCLAAARVARERGLETVGLTGAAGGALKALVTVAICIPSTDTQRIQEGHLVAGHLLCEWAEQALAPSR